jgi:hypothetical protein
MEDLIVGWEWDCGKKINEKRVFFLLWRRENTGIFVDIY